jgi:hypothetical protein
MIWIVSQTVSSGFPLSSCLFGLTLQERSCNRVASPLVLTELGLNPYFTTYKEFDLGQGSQYNRFLVIAMI